MIIYYVEIICRSRSGEITLDVGEVRLLVEAGGLESERVDNVVDSLAAILKFFAGFFGGGIGTDI